MEKAAAEVLNSPSFLLGIFILAALFMLGFGLIVWTRRWISQANTLAKSTQQDLEHYRYLHEQGELSDQEYEEICRLLVLPQENVISSSEPKPDQVPSTEKTSQSDEQAGLP